MARPDQVERRYRRLLLDLVDHLRASVRDNLIAALPMYVTERDLQTRTDSWVDDVVAAVTRIRLSMNPTERAVEREVVMIGQEVADFNESQWRRVVRSAVGVDFLKNEPWLSDELKSFAAENASLITDISDKAMTNVQGIVQRGVRSGLTSRELESQIVEQMDTTERRARLIARDQVSKLNGQITARRQQSVGIRTYYWDTSGDERVRKSHRAMNGKLCRWDDDSVYSDDGGSTWRKRSSIGGTVSKPGEDINCRCGARSNTDELLDELGI
ncbi:MAG: hypothetical protein Unbinned3138contig1000_50 [Prokaryotic dsDNA virus sp.]|nr:MAG: hypothetical protein Unbinned3138contig1000_50 [Prokaryotic dsDNA virus sp.]|tara:strand:- start:14555 stop:15367 length:813 start_codon:yes stop_codon:yes gene_type:complete